MGGGGWEEGRVGVPGLNILQRARQSARRGANERDELDRTITSLFLPGSYLANSLSSAATAPRLRRRSISGVVAAAFSRNPGRERAARGWR